MSHKRVARDIGLIAITQMFISLGGFFLLPIVTKMLGPDSYGIWAQINVTISLLYPLALFGLHMAFLRFLAAETDEAVIREGFYSIIFFVSATGSAISLAVYLLSDFLALTLFGDVEASYFVKAGSFLILLTAVDLVATFFFRISRETRIYAALSLFNSFGRLILILILLVLGFGIIGVIGGVFIIMLLEILISFVLIVRRIGFAFPKFTYIREYLRYSAPITPNSLIRWITESSDRFVIGFFLGVTSVGIYSAGYVIGGLIFQLMYPIQLILFPELSRLYDRLEIETVKFYLSISLKYFLLVAIPAVVGLSALAGPILNLFTTPQFAPGAVVIPFIALSGLLAGIYQIVINVTHLVKKNRFNLIIHVLAAVSNLLLNLLLIPLVGFIGAAIATLISYTITAIVAILFSFRYIRFKIYWSPISKSVAASGFMAGIILLLPVHSVHNLLFAVASGMVLYVMIMVLIKGLDMRELGSLKDLLLGR